jgi:membrane peptidoglycan carboxypeptidase
MATASLRAYAAGADTTAARQQLVAAYLDSVPLASRPGYGEVIGLGDGLWVWYGLDLGQVRVALEDGGDEHGPAPEAARAYKHALSLLLAERRPTWYLVFHRDRLERLTNHYLRLLADAGVISPALRDLALQVPLRFQEAAPPPPAPAFVQRKAVDTLRNGLLADLQVHGLGALDRLDLTVHSTIDARAQGEVTAVLQRLSDPGYAASLGLVGSELLPRQGLDQVLYSVLVYERTAGGNALRVHADSLNQPFDINSGGKLILGSTAKLRTLITYLDIVAELHGRLVPLPRGQRDAVAAQAGDPLSLWAAAWLDQAADRGLPSMLDAAMQRRYPASPHASFFTGGGTHVFHNFRKFEDGEKPTVENAFARSVNLAFVRLMRDLTRYYTAQQGDTVRRLLSDRDDAGRRDYLRRFADQEGRQYLGRFYEDYRGLSPGQALQQLVDHARPSVRSLTAIFAALRPDASTVELFAFLRERLPQQAIDERLAGRIFAQCRSGRLGLSDQGYLAGVHPLELWLLGYLRDHPDATRAEMLRAGAPARQQAYDWLFRTQHAVRQDERIRILLEQMAFEHIADDWHRQGYPFHTLVPSLASAIGSSGDRPDALAELAGVISSGGLRLPPREMTAMRFAAGTPYETTLVRRPEAAERVLDPEVAAAVRRAMQGVVDYGTAQRLRGAYLQVDGSPLPVAGKTGTGDNRLESFSAGHRLISSTATSRSAAFVFLLGERHFGVITVYVPGEKAGRYHFTSALAVQLLRGLAPALSPLIEGVQAGPAVAGLQPAGISGDAP